MKIFEFQFPALFLGETKISADKRGHLNEAFTFMETFLENMKWFCGDTPTIADLSVYASLSSIVVSGTIRIFEKELPN